MFRKILIWYKAAVLDYPYYRVVYVDGKRTRLLHYLEASGLARTFNGRLIIDYDVKF